MQFGVFFRRTQVGWCPASPYISWFWQEQALATTTTQQQRQASAWAAASDALWVTVESLQTLQGLLLESELVDKSWFSRWLYCNVFSDSCASENEGRCGTQPKRGHARIPRDPTVMGDRLADRHKSQSVSKTKYCHKVPCNLLPMDFHLLSPGIWY